MRVLLLLMLFVGVAEAQDSTLSTVSWTTINSVYSLVRDSCRVYGHRLTGRTWAVRPIAIPQTVELGDRTLEISPGPITVYDWCDRCQNHIWTAERGADTVVTYRNVEWHWVWEYRGELVDSIFVKKFPNSPWGGLILIESAPPGYEMKEVYVGDTLYVWHANYWHQFDIGLRDDGVVVWRKKP